MPGKISKVWKFCLDKYAEPKQNSRDLLLSKSISPECFKLNCESRTSEFSRWIQRIYFQVFGVSVQPITKYWSWHQCYKNIF